MLLVIFAMSGCGGGGGSGGGSSVTPPPVVTTTVNFDSDASLIDNSDAAAFNILLMGNSHSSAIQAVLQAVIAAGAAPRSVDVQHAPGFKFLSDRVDDGESAELLGSRAWTHVILQAQKYSTSGTVSYPTTAAEYWIRGVKSIDATPILFPEHPRRGNTWEGATLWDLHMGIADREPSCVAPVGLAWDEMTFVSPGLELHQADGNHASGQGAFLTSLVFYPIITGLPVEELPYVSDVGVSAEVQQSMRETVAKILFLYPPCTFD
jgi:hypothetical protein